MRLNSLLLPLFVLAFAMGCRTPNGAQAASWHTTPSGLGVREIVEGTGPLPRPGQTCVVEVMGWIEEGGAKGRVILDSRKRGYPAVFPLGGGRVIPGWEEALASLHKGGKRLVRVPPALGYSASERGQDIPEGAVLLFELELVDLR